MPRCWIDPAGNSTTEWIFQLTGLILHGRSLGQTACTRCWRSSATTSMAKSIPKVCTPEEGRIHKPASASSRLRPSSPIRRMRKVSANAIRVPTVVARVLFVIVTSCIGMDRCFFLGRAGRCCFGSMPPSGFFSQASLSPSQGGSPRRAAASVELRDTQTENPLLRCSLLAAKNQNCQHRDEQDSCNRSNTHTEVHSCTPF